MADGLKSLPREQLLRMAAAGDEIKECYRILRKAGHNVVGQCLAHQGTFYEMQHYPKGDVYDKETHGQYYYHAHREDADEHGHFHTFVRAAGMPKGVKPVPYRGKAKRPTGKNALCHIAAISMNANGFPIGLFTTNRWVTDETFYPAEDVIRIIDRFRIDHTHPCHAVNRWISAMMVLFRPDLETLLHERDRVLNERAGLAPDEEILDDRGLEVISSCDTDVDARVTAIRQALAA